MALNETVQYAEEFILSELPGKISRDTVTVTVAASTTLYPGRVLGKVSATGKYVVYDETATDGSGDAAAVLVREVANSGLSPADFTAVVINWSAELSENGVDFGDGDVTTGTADLAALGIKLRASVPDATLNVNS